MGETPPPKKKQHLPPFDESNGQKLANLGLKWQFQKTKTVKYTGKGAIFQEKILFYENLTQLEEKTHKFARKKVRIYENFFLLLQIQREH